MRILKINPLLGILVSLLVSGAYSAPRDFAVGVTLGSPMGLSLMQNLDETSAVQAAFEVNVENPFTMHADYLLKVNGLFDVAPENGKFQLYYGPGLRMEVGSRKLSPFGPYRTSRSGRVGLRFPVGLQYYLPRIPFDLFAEAAPMLTLWRATHVDMTAALGVRFNL